jgi:hypothetical protein
MKKNILRYICLGSALCISIVWGIERISLSVPIPLSTQTPDLNGAYKGKLVRTTAGILVVVYGDFVEDDLSRYVYDAKQSSERPARDVFITVCDSAGNDCSVKSNWSLPINISNTALMSSMQTDWNGDGNRTPYHGDSDNPHVFASGDHVVVTWVDKYCPGGAQRSVTYPESDDREIAMSCVYAAHATSDFSAWVVDQLSDGSRDAKQDVSKGLSNGAWAITWQEDPLGLQPGEAEGPGDGSSGAKTSNGTDIWYTFALKVSGPDQDIGVWKTPVRVTNNQTGFGLPPDSSNPIKDSVGNTVNPDFLGPGTGIETGEAGASRANMSVIGGSSPPTAVIAYEESKGSAGLSQGKFVRFHQFPYNKPPTAANDKAGCIVSNPLEGARRARFVAQTNAGSDSGIRFALFWRQGLYDQGGPADIMMRIGYKSADALSTGLRPEDLSPAVDPGCYALDYAAAANLGNVAPLNISTNTPAATDANLSDSSEANSLENARAHRGVLRGDDLYMGYIYAEDGRAADATDLDNYNFYVRRFNAANGAWGSPVNLSNFTFTGVNVLEPRLVGMPGNGPGCPDPTDPTTITNPEDCQDKSVILAAWGSETNVYDNAGSSENLDIYITRTVDKAESWEPIRVISGTSSQGELQIRPTPDGNRLFAVWSETANAITNTMFSLGVPETYTPIDDDARSGSSCSIKFL